MPEDFARRVLEAANHARFEGNEKRFRAVIREAIASQERMDHYAAAISAHMDPNRLWDARRYDVRRKPEVAVPCGRNGLKPGLPSVGSCTKRKLPRLDNEGPTCARITGGRPTFGPNPRAPRAL